MNTPIDTDVLAAKDLDQDNAINRVLVLEMVRVTEAAAVAAAQLIGRGDEKAADAAAVEAMRRAFDTLYMDGTVVIGEGERDEAPMLYIGEKVGMGKGPQIDIALDPLEGTTITAKAGPNALAVLAAAERADLCLIIGSTGTVYPAASLPRIVKAHGGAVIEINPEASEFSAGVADIVLPLGASAALRALDALLRPARAV